MSKLNPIVKNTGSRFDTVNLAGGQGAAGAKQSPLAQLRRAVLACLLWEDTAYQSGEDGASNIASLIPQCDPMSVAALAVEAREAQKLRHVPLYIASEMLKHEKTRPLVSQILPQICTRPDMLTDFLAIYWKEGKKPIAAQAKKGLNAAFHNFTEYSLAKYDRDSAIKLRDVMFLTRPKPENEIAADLFKKIANRTLATPDTWEVTISASKDKKADWTRLIKENKLGGLAFLRNLRNMKDAGVDHNVIRQGLRELKSGMLLPLNFMAAARYAPEFSEEIQAAMQRAYKDLETLPGKTIFVIDVSGSMGGMNGASLSENSHFTRLDQAAAMALLAINRCENIDVYCTAGGHSHATEKIEYPSMGFRLFEQIQEKEHTLGGGGIFTRQCLDYLNELYTEKPERIIIFSDSQDCDSEARTIPPKPFGNYNYIVDVSSHSHGVNYKGVWTAEISGWSQNFMTYIASYEGLNNQFED